MGVLITAGLPSAVRAALDTSLDEAGLPSDVIFQPLYAEDAEAELLQRDPAAAGYPDDLRRQRALNAVALLTAARIAPVLPGIVQMQLGDFRYQRVDWDGAKVAALLRGRAAAEIALNTEATGQLQPLPAFWLGAGRRGA